MDPQTVLDALTGPLARLVAKLGAMAGVSATVLSQDKATQVATALLTLLAFGVEIVQSHYAVSRAGQKAIAGMTPPLPPPSPFPLPPTEGHFVLTSRDGSPRWTKVAETPQGVLGIKAGSPNDKPGTN